ncbi:BrnA antitoxin family protein [Chloroflexi bacterium TSY]|nr:BrnA antitoxin family protein [Chloroflexi bacterium TSY]
MENKQAIPERDPIPEEFNSLAEAGDFWDTHDSADYEDLMEEVTFEINLPPKPTRSYAIAKDLATQLQAVAKQQGISTQTLINLWLQEKLMQATS